MSNLSNKLYKKSKKKKNPYFSQPEMTEDKNKKRRSMALQRRSYSLYPDQKRPLHYVDHVLQRCPGMCVLEAVRISDLLRIKFAILHRLQTLDPGQNRGRNSGKTVLDMWLSWGQVLSFSSTYRQRCGQFVNAVICPESQYGSDGSKQLLVENDDNTWCRSWF